MTKPWDRQTFPKEDQTHGWIQWKGTNVSMDVHCKCGFQGHIVAGFAYNVQCPECKRVYMVNGHVEFVELTPEEVRNAGSTIVAVD